MQKLYQLQQRSRNTGKFEFVAQRSICRCLNAKEIMKEYNEWIGDVKERHPLKGNAEWWMVDETSSHFMTATQQRAKTVA